MTWPATVSGLAWPAGSSPSSVLPGLVVPTVVEPTPDPTTAAPTPEPSTAAVPVAGCGLSSEAPCWVALDPGTTALLGVGFSALVMLAAARLWLGLAR